MTFKLKNDQGPEIGTPPTSTDHLIDVLRRLRDELLYVVGMEGTPEGWSGVQYEELLKDADDILETYGIQRSG